ncbi:MAG TPA: RNA polymerase factor sigma-70 [Prevotella sp.]|nr:RNA polymerase factor sigma-70 [Candidatus Segatella violae]
MNDKREFDRLFLQWYEPLFLFAMKFVKDEEVGKDIVNDAFEYLWKNFAEVDAATVKTYLFTIVRTKCIDYLRKQTHQNQYIAFVSKMSQAYIDIDIHEPDERLLKIRLAMQKLTPYNRMILQECFINNKKSKEVAEELSVSVAAIHKNIVKALRVIREYVGN